VIDGVDVVADNAAGLLVSLRTGHGDVVGGDIERWVVLSEKTSTPLSVGITIDTWAGNISPPTKSAHPQIKEHHD
jgi:hypothetical protein